jgi:hypothetical protein
MAGATTSSTSLVTSIGNVASGFASSFIGLAKGKSQLPMPNVLSRFASYNYTLGLSCLPVDDTNFPDETYLSGKKYNYILKSASIDSTHRFTSGATKLDYFMTDLTINGGYGFEKRTGNTNSIDLEFTVVEPYSMGQFVTVMQVAAYNNNYPNYNEANYLLEIQFRGNTETGQLVNIAEQTKFIPIQIVTIAMKVNAGGATYQVKAIPTNADGLKDLYTDMKSDTAISGETVQEVLQSGPKSLQALLNRLQRNLAREDKSSADGKPRQPDQIYIIFPKERASSGAGSTSVGSALPSTATVSTVSSLQSKLKVSQSGDPSIIKQDSEVNPIGLAKMDFDLARQGLKEFPDYLKTWDNRLNEDGSGGWVRASNVSDPKNVSFQFTQNTKIQDIINSVIQNSAYAKQAMDSNNIDKSLGMRAWWRIDMQVYHVKTTENEKITGRLPKIIVYRVIPYGVHASKLTAPNAGTSIDGLAKQVPKFYQYIYTGKNTEILNFDIEIKNNFISAFTFDNFRRGQDTLIERQKGIVSDANTANKPQVNIEPVTGEEKPEPAVGQSQVANSSVTKTGSGASGTPSETTKVRAARLMHDAITDASDMVNLNLKIMGDPFWIANSGMGNFTSVATDQINVTPDASVDYQSSEVHAVINFRSPTDIDQSTGLYKKDTDSTSMFSGLYKVVTVQSHFKDGQFTQTLKGFRVPNQQNGPSDKEGSHLSSNTKADSAPPANKDNLDGPK